MKSDIRFWQTAGFFIVSILGVFLHFLYDLSGNIITALISSVNESTWEHMKLIFFPMLIYAVIQYFIIGKNIQNFWCIKLKGVLLALILIPVLFYTLHGSFSNLPDFINILIFFIAVASAFIYETRQLQSENVKCMSQKLALAVLFLISVAFIAFTFLPPEIPLFKDPISGRFGV